ncbi:twin-arginine translocase TatA/TatE family subunit [Paenibacillus eucommiae]|uniref:Sec-independent protein translocase protein TatA n=1 Tax=Paenibacillus eucommiae TaxID=1355755 RepID=A0ABS4IND8_9BACL|nr:twin-arginine translocase TatA/TatE family subunit [Paenibacillus eucommiae]MBP1988546.1 sec-independent protein translocase protein TatA [Paenibacillus eucommiae]
MLGNIGLSGFLLIAILAIVLFGPSKLPELGRAVGKTLSEFKKGTKELLDSNEGSSQKERTTIDVEKQG